MLTSASTNGLGLSKPRVTQLLPTVLCSLLFANVAHCAPGKEKERVPQTPHQLGHRSLPLLPALGRLEPSPVDHDKTQAVSAVVFRALLSQNTWYSRTSAASLDEFLLLNHRFRRCLRQLVGTRKVYDGEVARRRMFQRVLLVCVLYRLSIRTNVELVALRAQNAALVDKVTMYESILSRVQSQSHQLSEHLHESQITLNHVKGETKDVVGNKQCEESEELLHELHTANQQLMTKLQEAKTCVAQQETTPGKVVTRVKLDIVPQPSAMVVRQGRRTFSLASTTLPPPKVVRVPSKWSSPGLENTSTNARVTEPAKSRPVVTPLRPVDMNRTRSRSSAEANRKIQRVFRKTLQMAN